MQKDYLETDFLSIDQGYAYLIAKLTAFYGNRFLTNFQGIDPRMMKETWIDILGKHLTYKPKIDHVIRSLDPEGYIANPNQIFNLCNEIKIPVKPETTITHQKLESQKIADAMAKEEAMKKMKEFIGGFGK